MVGMGALTLGIQPLEACCWVSFWRGPMSEMVRAKMGRRFRRFTLLPRTPSGPDIVFVLRFSRLCGYCLVFRAAKVAVFHEQRANPGRDRMSP
ncbi:hypothetical protein BC939DRAFT_469140 [Gamsiella multidivaricata]|uniref:uncharacterized protein n=1 Tax=Gamsiella multidivaricata TaxID=101098 RepID=UPI0022206BEF|nr:uncharacterized protein BC939DRAFT_469140 [Gamsiella multidivaricata]KAI7816420.1 hypothetical protein BC939DRAFT_469140 [Gamsiella multidivaricata]